MELRAGPVPIVSRTMTKLPERNLDVLRAIAVLCVLIDHTLGAVGRTMPWLSNWELGRIGVLLFFVHTSTVLMSSIERQGMGARWIQAFYVRRAFRIYPLAIATILIVVALQIPSRVLATEATPFIAPSLRTLFANIALVQNVTGDRNVLGPLWSLPLEVQMYLVLPFCYSGIVSHRTGFTRLGTIALVCSLMFVTFGAEADFFWRFSVLSYAPCFIAGVMTYAMLRYRPHWTKWPSWTLPFLIIGLVFAFPLLQDTP